jgi:hypothetical protein
MAGIVPRKRVRSTRRPALASFWVKDGPRGGSYQMTLSGSPLYSERI